jgi:hypothetical protein
MIKILLYILVIIAIGVVAGFIFNNALVGFFTVGGIIVLWAIWGAVQEAWAWITKTGIYEEKDKEE